MPKLFLCCRNYTARLVEVSRGSRQTFAPDQMDMLTGSSTIEADSVLVRYDSIVDLSSGSVDRLSHILLSGLIHVHIYATSAESAPCQCLC